MLQEIEQNPDRKMRDAPIELNLRNAKYWLRYMIRHEQFHHAGRNGSPTVWRMLRLLRPNLRDPVFAIGAPRSGTTFLGSCLSQLPELSYHFEPVLTKAAVRCIYDGSWSDRRARWLYRTTYAWLMRMRNEGDLRFCDKTPGSCFVLPFLDKTFDNARFIHIIRDGRDSALSLSKKPWYRNDAAESGIRDPDGYRLGPSRRFWVESERAEEYETTTDLHRCIWLWRRYVECALEGAKAIDPDRYLELRYEALLANPAEHATTISDFLQIDTAASREKLRGMMTAESRMDSIGRWSKEIEANDLDRMNREAGQLLRQLDY